nr:MAG TPA: hypothetical protein [Caudoviricetes sp.]
MIWRLKLNAYCSIHFLISAWDPGKRRPTFQFRSGNSFVRLASASLTGLE